MLEPKDLIFLTEEFLFYWNCVLIKKTRPESVLLIGRHPLYEGEVGSNTGLLFCYNKVVESFEMNSA